MDLNRSCWKELTQQSLISYSNHFRPKGTESLICFIDAEIHPGVRIKRCFLTVALQCTITSVGTSPSMGFAFGDVMLLLEDL